MTQSPEHAVSSVVGRLAPSPTGAQHIGNARTYLIAWLAARMKNGLLPLRIEDIDSPRVKPEATQQIYDDLAWLGLNWDGEPVVQSSRLPLYEEQLATLQERELVYPCTCTRRDIEQAASAPHAGQEGPVYPGTCANRGVRDALSLDQPYCWRFRFEDAEYSFIDSFAGNQSARPSEIGGDFVVWKSDGTPAYQLAVVVDDAQMNVNQVVRGDDLIPSAFRQMALYHAFGWQVPEYVHVPLVVGTDGRRLAKRHGDTRLESLRQTGVSSALFLGFLAWSCGWIVAIRETSLAELLERFDLRTIPPEAFVLRGDLLEQIGYYDYYPAPK